MLLLDGAQRARREDPRQRRLALQRHQRHRHRARFLGRPARRSSAACCARSRSRDTVAFFREIGVGLHEEAGGKLFPDTNRARDVLDALLDEAQRRGASSPPARACSTSSATADGFRIDDHRAATFAPRRVVLATGGQSLPKSGSDGAGFEIARRLGHTIVPTTPALAPLLLAGGDDSMHARAVAACRTTVELDASGSTAPSRCA